MLLILRPRCLVELADMVLCGGRDLRGVGEMDWPGFGLVL